MGAQRIRLIPYTWIYDCVTSLSILQTPEIFLQDESEKLQQHNVELDEKIDVEYCFCWKHFNVTVLLIFEWHFRFQLSAFPGK